MIRVLSVVGTRPEAIKMAPVIAELRRWPERFLGAWGTAMFLLVPLFVFGGEEYGTGSSRDWAAKGTLLLGVRAVIAESFERIHRSNLVGMGILPLQFVDGATRESLGLTGREIYAIEGITGEITPRMRVTVRVTGEGGERTFPALARIDTPAEVHYYLHGGILPYVLRRLIGRG
mgnify:CR=1 FL=1